MNVEIELTDDEIKGAIHRGFKKALVDEMTTASWKNGAMSTQLTEAVDKIIPVLIEQSHNDADIQSMVSRAVERKASYILAKMVR